MVARSTTRSNQRPDTLMQDRKSAKSTKTSCDARPDHTIGSFASIPRCPPHVRLAGNFGHAGWLLIALDRQWYIAYRSSDEALLAAMLRPAPFARGRLAGETGGLVRVTRKPQ